MKETMESHFLVGNNDDVTQLGKKNQSLILVKFISFVRKLKTLKTEYRRIQKSEGINTFLNTSHSVVL